ncbi:MAG: phosphotransferase [Patescibacteria group bacterium]
MKKFEALFKKVNFHPQKAFRKGPRVWVIGGDLEGKPAVFKTPFGGEGKETVLDEHLRREALFLESAPAYLVSHLPILYRQGKEERFWYLVEWVQPGVPQSLESSDFLMADTFFTLDNLEWVLEVLEGLRKMSLELPGEFKKDLNQTAYELSSYRRLLEPQGRQFFAEPKVWEKITDFLDAAEPAYNRFNQTTVTHHEFYGSQILSSIDSFKLCDWENVGWGHPLRDFTSLWIRAFKHPAWQKDFLAKFHARAGMEDNDFDTLFGVEKILQNFGNLGLPELGGEDFFRNCIVEVIS